MSNNGFWFSLFCGWLGGMFIACLILDATADFNTLNADELTEANHEVVYSDWLQVDEILPSTDNDGKYDVRLKGNDFVIVLENITSDEHLRNGYLNASIIKYTGDEKKFQGDYLLMNDKLRKVELLPIN